MRAHYRGVRIRPAAARSWHEEFHDWMRTNILNEAWAIVTCHRPPYPIFFQQFQFFDHACQPITIFDIDFTGYEYDIASHPQPPHLPVHYVDPFPASVNRIADETNPAKTTSFEALKREYDRLKEFAKETSTPILVAAQKTVDEADAVLRELETPQPVTCPGCFKVLLCHPFKYAILKVKISWFYTCKDCKLPVIAFPQFLSWV